MSPTQGRVGAGSTEPTGVKVVKYLGIGCLVAIVAAVLLAIGVVVYGVGVVNRGATLRNEAAVQEKANQAVFDDMWKQIAQIAELNDSYKEDFRKAWADILKAQNSGERGGQINVIINRMNPKFDSKLTGRVMTVVESKRTQFLNHQKKLLDIKLQHDNLRTRFPSGFILRTFGDASELDVKIVTSTRTQDTFESGKDDDISLRPGQKKEPEKKAEPQPAGK